ncbi:MAG: hypothetical protein J5I47_04000 [Vicingus serpentipes]|nr:hypothetical protein [Vicingus serpentipes]
MVDIFHFTHKLTSNIEGLNIHNKLDTLIGEKIGQNKIFKITHMSQSTTMTSSGKPIVVTTVLIEFDS